MSTHATLKKLQSEKAYPPPPYFHAVQKAVPNQEVWESFCCSACAKPTAALRMYHQAAVPLPLEELKRRKRRSLFTQGSNNCKSHYVFLQMYSPSPSRILSFSDWLWQITLSSWGTLMSFKTIKAAFGSKPYWNKWGFLLWTNVPKFALHVHLNIRLGQLTGRDGRIRHKWEWKLQTGMQ